mgnify:CR=1 FL=1
MNESKVLGKFARLYVSKITKFGVMLRSFEEKDLEVLLPNNQVKKGTEKGDFYEVFLYKDSEDRLIATTQRPYLSLGETAVLEVKDVTGIGAGDLSKICCFLLRSRQKKFTWVNAC